MLMRYFVLQGNDALGPFSEDEMRELSEQGYLQQTTNVCTEDGARSGMLSEILPLIASKMTALEKASSAPPSAAADLSSEIGRPITEDSRPRPTTDPLLRQDGCTPGQWSGSGLKSDVKSDVKSDAKSDARYCDSDVGGTEGDINKWTIIGSLVIAAAGLFFFSQRGKWTFFDGVNLIFHEAGHLVLGFMPQFIVALAGTLFQLLIPGLLAFYFHRHEKMFATQFCMTWLGQSLLNVSNYIADARAQVLPLVGGGEHDWTYLLGKMGVLQHDISIGKFLNGIALLIFAVATAWPWLCQWWEERRNVQSSEAY